MARAAIAIPAPAPAEPPAELGEIRGWGARLRAFRLLVWFSFRTSPWRATAHLLVAAFREITYLGTAYGAKLMIDAVVQRASGGVLLAALVWAAAYGLSQWCQRFLVSSGIAINEKAGSLVDRSAVSLLSRVPTIEHYERPAYLDHVALLRGQRWRLVALNALTVNIRQWTLLLGSGALLARLHPALLLLPLFGLGSMWTGRKAHEIQQRAERANAERGRLRRHLFATATSAAIGKELRIFGLAAEIEARHHAIADQMTREIVRSTWQCQLLGMAGSLLFAIGYIAAVGLVLVRAVQGRATPGDVVLAIGLAALMSGSIAAVIETAAGLRLSFAQAGRYLWLEDFTREAERRFRTAEPVPAPGRLTRGITLEHLSFRYPGTEAPALSDVSVVLPAGGMVALVGENGAGKTTLVKLLCRFYEPDEGRILVDGTDVRRFDVDTWRMRLSTAFQDFAKFEFRARETIGCGDLPRIEDQSAVERALVRAGATDVLAALPDGLETPLGKAWGGVELSGGQWQKLALARGLVRDTPLLLVLDEPTAALDAQTEHALFERFAAAAKSGEASGTVTLVVSHRFSTVRIADLIVVLNKGRVVEAGNHADLMARDGLYAELYGLQARGYN